MPEYAKDVLVDTEWVERHLDDESIRIVEVDENPALYADSHIPGAIDRKSTRLNSSHSSPSRMPSSA